jgi:hydroxyacylglutathione hydrolase
MHAPAITITPLKAFKDNYIWVIRHLDEVVVVDPGEAQVVINYLTLHRLKLRGIFVTHGHNDHIGGVAKLSQLYPEVEVISNLALELVDGAHLALVNWLDIQVITTPGHMLEHVCYLLNQTHLLCGDALFSLGCGRVFTQDYQASLTSLNKIKALPSTVLCYPAHEYTEVNYQFSLKYAPDPAKYTEFGTRLAAIRQVGNPSLPTLLADELALNLFLSCNDASLMAQLSQFTATPINDELACFMVLRELRNCF